MKTKYFIIGISLAIIALVVAFGQFFTVRSINVVFDNKTGIATETDILEISGINNQINIFNIKENEIKKRVALAYDNYIVVEDVERQIPNKVNIYVKERTPIFKVQRFTAEGDDYIATDKDFQRTHSQKEQDITAQLIEVKGLLVKDSFDVAELKALRKVAYAFIDNGLDEEALPYFIEKINFSEDNLQIYIRQTNAVLTVRLNSAYDDTARLYLQYLQVDLVDRYGLDLKII